MSRRTDAEGASNVIRGASPFCISHTQSGNFGWTEPYPRRWCGRRAERARTVPRQRREKPHSGARPERRTFRSVTGARSLAHRSCSDAPKATSGRVGAGPQRQAMVSGEREDITPVGLAWWRHLNFTAPNPCSLVGRKRWGFGFRQPQFAADQCRRSTCHGSTAG